MEKVTSAVFGDVELSFCCNVGSCMCEPEERIIRAYAGGHMKGIPMSDLGRTWACIEADRCGEGLYDAEELRSWSDGDLARAVVDAWSSYAG